MKIYPNIYSNQNPEACDVDIEEVSEEDEARALAEIEAEAELERKMQEELQKFYDDKDNWYFEGTIREGEEGTDYHFV